MSDWTSIATAVEEAYSTQATLVFTGEHKAQITLRCPWAQRYNVAVDIIGNNRLWPDASIGAMGGSVTIRPAPQSAPASVSAGGIISYDEALLDVSYDVAQFGKLDKYTSGPNAGQIYSESLEPTIEYLKTDKDGFCWGGNKNGTPVTKAQSPGRPMRGMNLVRTLYQVTSIHSSVLTLGGKSNAVAYTSPSLGLTFPIETLIFITPTLERTFDISGTKGFNVKLKFGYKEKGWNKFWNELKSGTDKYDTIWDVANNAQYKPFPPDDFSAWLF